MKYGLPYKGSKNKLAERIVRLLPKRQAERGNRIVQPTLF